MRKHSNYLMPFLAAALLFSGCSNTASENDTEQASSAEVTQKEESVSIFLSDGEIISTDSSNAVYVGDDIVYYEEGKDETYGEGSKEDSHSEEEAKKHTVVTITKPGTYVVSGKLPFGQIAVDLGEDAREDEEAVVNLVLNNAEINCSVAPSIVVYNAYECGSDKEDDADPIVNTESAGFNLILAKDSENIINGSYVAKIYKDGTTKEDIENGDAKKKYKFDAAIDSLVSFNINSEENGKLIVNAENEGISSGLHMTVNGGEIIINASDDSINTNEDNVSVFTMNGGTIICDSGSGKEGDGIDSNGYIVINGGFVIACANPASMDSGLDSDKGIYINGGTVLGSGNMYDEVSNESAQLFMVLSFDKGIKENNLIMLTDGEDNPITAFSAANDYSIAVYSSPELTEENYHLYEVSSVTGDLNGSIYTNITDYEGAVQLSFTSDSMRGFGGGIGKMPSVDGEFPQFSGGDNMSEMREGEEPPERPDDGNAPKMREGKEPTEHPDGDVRPEKPEGDDFREVINNMEEPSIDFNLSKDAYQFSGISEN